MSDDENFPEQGVDPVTTRTEMTWIVMPGQANALGTVFGGQIMAWIDVCAAVSAQRFARCEVVTLGMDRLSFKAPIRQGEIVVIQASVNWAGRSSMEVGVRVEKEVPTTGQRIHTSTAYLTFVALSSDGKPCETPTLSPKNDVQRRRWREAVVRRRERLAARESKA